MRRRTGLALGGIVAGTLLMGAGTTLATFTDSASDSAEIGAGQLSLTVTPAATPVQLVPGAANATTLPVSRTGSGRALLHLSVQDGSGPGACDGQSAQVVVGAVGDVDPVRTDLCALLTSNPKVLVFTAGTTAADLAVRITAGSRGWSGTLVFTLEQPGGDGFSDTQSVPVQVIGRGGS
jgi:predicted ribosomally synthesized peptide with SipW-like signal peptide